MTAPRLFSEFMRERVGPSWVIARRTTANVRRHGETCVFLTGTAYQTLHRQWDEETDERLGEDPAGVLAAFLAASTPRIGPRGRTDRIMPDEGYWQALERLAAKFTKEARAA